MRSIHAVGLGVVLMSISCLGWISFPPDSFSAVSHGITSLAYQNDSTLWAATGGGGVLRYDASGWELFTEYGSSLSDDEVYVVCVHGDANGDTWFGTRNGLSVLRNGSTWETFDANDGLPSNEIDAIAVDSGGNKWLGTPGGIVKYDGVSFTVHNSDSGVTSDLINALAVDQSNNVWAATSSGLLKYDGSTWTQFGLSHGLPHVHIRDVCIDRSGVVWLATLNGVVSFNGTTVTDTVDNPVTADGNAFYTVRQDSAGFYWMGSYFSGLFRYDGTSLVQFDTLDGLVGNNVTAIAINSGHVRWIGTAGGLTVFGNTSPQVAATADTSIVANDDLVHQIQGSDSDKEDEVSYYLAKGPSGMSVDGSNGTVTWTPTSGDIGTDTVVVQVSDQYGASVYDTFLVEVQPPLGPVAGRNGAVVQAFVDVRGSNGGIPSLVFGLTRDQNVRIEILDLLGRRIDAPVYRHRRAGIHTVDLCGMTVSSGTYLCRFVSEELVSVRKLRVAN